MFKVSQTTTFTNPSEGVITTHNTKELQNIQSAYRLNEKNYLKWSQLVCLLSKEKSKIKSPSGN